MIGSRLVCRLRRTVLLMLIGVLCFTMYHPGLAQDQDELRLSLRRDFGYSSGTGRIQGRFTAIADGPADLVRVVFLIDGQEMGEVTRTPGMPDADFKLQFHTGDYDLGVHTLSAIGYTVDGRELKSNEQRREFTPAEEGWQAAGKIAIPLISVVFLVMLLSFVLPMVLGRRRRSQLPLGAPRNYGMLGGAICPKCTRPFGMHIWGLNLVTGKLDRCPHCGRWSLVRRAWPEALRAAEEAELQQAQAPITATPASSEGDLRKELDDSRFRNL